MLPTLPTHLGHNHSSLLMSFKNQNPTFQGHAPKASRTFQWLRGALPTPGKLTCKP